VAHEKITNSVVLDSDCIVSFDAVSLFTSIPVEDTINHILDIVPHTEIPFKPETLKQLLMICCTNVPFMFNNKNYTQIGGLSMGSCLAPLMAEFAMNMIESKLKMPKVYLRYVDDIFAVFNNSNDATNFLKEMNSINCDLKFTIENAIDSSIKFLDMNVTLENNSLKTNWILKTTNTGLYTPKISYSPDVYKKNAIKALYNRSQRLTQNGESKAKNKDIVKDIFIKNGYHPSFIEKCFTEKSTKIPTNDDKSVLYYGLPFLKECHKLISTGIGKINGLLKQTKIIPYFKTLKTQHFFQNKDKLSPNVSSSLVYKFDCEQCEACYIGETRRHLHTRITEHLRGNPPSEISKHRHIPSSTNFQILKRTFNTKIAETLYIQKHKNNNSTQLLNNFNSSEPLFLFN